jgi:hypothetical protein
MKPFRNPFVVLLLAALASTGCSDAPGPLSTDVDVQFSRGRQAVVDVIVVIDASFAPGGHVANQAAAAAIARSLGIEASASYGTALFGFAGSVPEGRINGLANDPRVAYVERDQVASIPAPRAQAPKFCKDNPSHPACGDGGDEDPPTSGQTTPWGIDRVGGAIDAPTATAWVIDTGIDFGHSDLNADEGRSRNFVTRGKKSASDGNGHGTHVTGTIGAIDNSQDVVGVAAGASVVAIRVLDNSGSGAYSWVIAGVDYVAANAGSGDVANMSLGGTTLPGARRRGAQRGRLRNSLRSRGGQ